MKHLVLTVLGAAFAAPPCLAQSSSFDPASGILTIPCLYASDLGQAADALYEARLRRMGQSAQFTLEQVRSATYDTECSGSFHLGTKVFTDVVNVGDNSYHVRMHRSADGSFMLDAATLRGAATTSLWVARSGGNIVYLAGTIHLLRDSDYPLPRAYDEAYAQASTLWFELDYDNPTETGAGLTPAQFDALMRDPEGSTLDRELTPVTYGLLRDYLADTWDLPVENINHWSAQAFANTYFYRHLAREYGVSAAGVDRHLATRAISDGKTVHGFETLASHYHIIHTLNEGSEEQVIDGFLFATLSGGDFLGFEQLVGIWRSGDTTELGRRVTALRDSDLAGYQLLHGDRNTAWVPEIEAMLRTPETEMVVVGAAHMAGPDGVIAQLRRLGYDVRRY